MVVMIYRYFATRQSPAGRAELIERVETGPLHRGGQLEHWRVRYLDPPDEDSADDRIPPESVTIRTDEPDLRPTAKRRPRTLGRPCGAEARPAPSIS